VVVFWPIFGELWCAQTAVEPTQRRYVWAPQRACFTVFAVVKLIDPFYLTAGRARRPCPLEPILRVHLMQHGLRWSDPAMEEALY